jgi:imidazolonepropionase-like amidohydrolase
MTTADDGAARVIRVGGGWDPAHGALDGPLAVWVSDAGKILRVAPRCWDPPGVAELVDLGDDVTLMPGLVDCHAHLCWDPAADPVEQFLLRDDAALLGQARRSAAQALAAGITTVRDLGDRGFVTVCLRDEATRHPDSLPEILVSGPPITPPQGHCWFLGGETLPGDVERAVVERAGRGVDVIKVMATGGMLTPGSAPHDSQYDRSTLERVVRSAGQRSLPVTAHAHGGAGIRDAVAAGIQGIEHCTFVTADDVECDWHLVEAMAAAGTHVSATEAWLPYGVPLPPRVASRCEKVWANFARMHAAGVRMAISSDAGIGAGKPHDVLSHGAVFFADAMVAVTAASAAACGLDRRKGRIAPGYDADLLAVAGDPISDITALLRPAQVFRAGRPIRMDVRTTT